MLEERGEAAARVAAWIYGEAGVDPREPRGAVVLAERLLGPHALHVAELALADASIRRVPGDAWITIRPGLPAPRAHFLIAHELAHLVVDDRPEYAGLSLLERERLCDAIGAWLVAPPEIFVRRALALRSSLPALAREFCITETCAAMRVAEVGGPGLAVVTPLGVHRRRFVGPSDEELRAGRLGPGLRKVTIRDEPGRAALVLRVVGAR